MNNKYFSILLFLIIILFPIQAKANSVDIIKVAGDENYPPYEFVDQNGVYKGFNVDIMRAVAADVKKNIEIVHLPWGAAIKQLDKGQVDALQGMTRSAARDKKYNFTSTLIKNSQGIFVRNDNNNISELDDLIGLTVAVQSEDISEEFIKKTPKIRIVVKSNQEQAMKELLEGRVDAFIGNKLTGIYILQKLKQLNKVKIAGDPLNLTEYCSVTLKGNTKVLNLLNKGIKDIKKNGTYEKIYRKWFGQSFFDNGIMTKELFLSISVVCSFIIGILVLIFLWNRSLKKLVVIKTSELAKANNELYLNQEKLEQSNRLQGKILENILDGIIAFDQRGKVLDANFAAKELLKIDIESELSFEDLSFDDYLISEGYEQALHGEIWRKDLLWDKGSGEILNIDCNISPIKGPGGEVEGVILVLHNYTESMLLDEAREFDKLKTEFFANISHELRTPLNLIFGVAQLLEMYKDDDNELALKNMVKKSTLVIRQNVNRLTRLINNIIDITKADTGFLELQLNNYNIVSVIEGVTMSIVDYCNNKGILLQFDTDIEEKIIACDAEKIERILLNLLSNSIKFTEDNGSIFVRVMDGEEFVTVSIMDSGIGIPNDKQEFIFERFRQVDKSISRRNEGSGIGLSLVKSLVEMHNGTINVVSKYGFGSEFIIKLPVFKLPNDPIEYIIDSFSSEKIKMEFSDIL